MWGFPSKKPNKTAKKKNGPSYKRRAAKRAGRDLDREAREKAEREARRQERLRGTGGSKRWSGLLKLLGGK